MVDGARDGWSNAMPLLGFGGHIVDAAVTIHCHDYDRDVVPSTLIFSGIYQGGGGFLSGADRLEVERDQVVGEFFGEAIATEEEAIVRLHVKLLDIHLAQVFSAQALRENVSPGVNSGLVGGEVSGLHGAGNPGVVFGDLFQSGSAQTIKARIPDVGAPGQGLAEDHHHYRRAHI